MVDYLYWSWDWILGLSAILGIASFVSPYFINKRRKIAGKENIGTFGVSILSTIGAIGLCICFFSLYVRNTYVQVPALRDKTV